MISETFWANLANDQATFFKMEHVLHQQNPNENYLGLGLETTEYTDKKERQFIFWNNFFFSLIR